MNSPHFTVIYPKGKGTTFLFPETVHILCRSADWYDFPPVTRYLMNMAATVIRMEDAKTETREFTHDRFKQLCDLIALSREDTPRATKDAWELWGGDGREFGVVHLDQEAGKRGDLLLGDDPNDVWVFWPWYDPQLWNPAQLNPSRGVEGSDV